MSHPADTTLTDDLLVAAAAHALADGATIPPGDPRLPDLMASARRVTAAVLRTLAEAMEDENSDELWPDADDLVLLANNIDPA